MCVSARVRGGEARLFAEQVADLQRLVADTVQLGEISRTEEVINAVVVGDAAQVLLQDDREGTQ